jgi:hypothetical protein
MNIPRFTAEASLYERRNIYHTTSGFVDDPAASMVVPQRLAYTCEGSYCDCEGADDCAKMINGACGGWTRCTNRGGVFRCLCTPRAIRI